MYGDLIAERVTSGYNTSTGKFVSEMVIPGGYGGLIYGYTIRKCDGMEMTNNYDFWRGGLDESQQAMYEDNTMDDLGDLIFILVDNHITQHLGARHANHPYGWQLESNPCEGFVVDFFMPEPVRPVPDLEFTYKDVEFCINFTGDLEACAEEDD